jgi:ferredoxin
MSQKLLKPARMVVSVLFFSAVFILFSFPLVLMPAWLTTVILFPGVISSFVGFIGTMAWMYTGFLVVLLITLLFGRIYCSSLCPLGTMMDLVIRAKRMFRPGYPRSPWKVNRTLCYAIAVLVFAAPVFRVMLPAGLTDPFGLAGKMFVHLSRPLFHPGLFPLTFSVAFWFALVVFLVVVITAYRSDRWYCNTLCPVGGLLGFASRVSLIRLRVDTERCTQCGDCSQVCKARCITGNHVDHSACVACFNCIDVCGEGAIKYGLSARQQRVGTEHTSASRRRFLLTSATVVVSLTGLAFLRRSRAGEPYAKAGIPVLPPGAGTPARFSEQCTSCHLCISACPTGVLQPAIFLPGSSGFLQPRLDFSRGFCLYECTRCSEVCPSGALATLRKDDKKQLKIGVAEFSKNLCIVVSERRSCGLCAARCPTRAIALTPYLGDLMIPVLDAEKCIGCGACEYTCPVRPARAIGVEGVEVQIRIISVN